MQQSLECPGHFWDNDNLHVGDPRKCKTRRAQLQIIERARERAQITPDRWDRDCRCCMSRGNNLGDKYLMPYRKIKHGVPVITIRGEEIHAIHTDQEILTWLGMG